MLVCPQCQFTNPDTNKFCQECGTSLAQNTCFDCGSLVSFNKLQCQKCGAITGVTWWAIMQNSGKLGETSSSTSQSAPTPATSEETQQFLDPRQRYQILEVFSVPTPETQERQGRVLDCQPFQTTMLEDNQEAGTAHPVVPAESNLPSIAQPYLALQDVLYQAIPAVHDVWTTAEQQVLLLEDRSQFPLLLDLWRNEDLSLPPLQILHSLYELVELWKVLAGWNCQSSLLEPNNLRVDEDHVVCLQRLYPDASDHPPTLQDLGQFWQTLFTESQRTQIASISLMLADLQTGKLTTVDALEARIEAIAAELQDTQPGKDELELDNSKLERALPSMMPAALPVTAAPSAIEAETRPPAPPLLEVSLQELAAMVDEDVENDSDEMPTVVLPMQLFSLEDVGRTDIGRQRDHNEDYFGIETQVSKLESPSGKTLHARNLYILCDGMGGHAGGEVASALAVDTLRRFFKDKWQNNSSSDPAANKLPGPDVLIEAVQLANKAIYDVNQQNARYGSGRMGTTLVMMLIQDTEVAVAHVGDSRLYRYTRKRGLEQITVDHEVGQREIQRGVEAEIAYARPDAYQLTQALGPRDEHFIKPDVQYLELNEDALLLLCSDGLTDNDLLENHASSHIDPLLSSQTNLEQGVTKLIELANQYNGHDNITAIVIRAKVRPNLQHLK